MSTTCHKNYKLVDEENENNEKQVIDYSSTNLVELPLENFQKLKSLYLENNNITALPDNLFIIAPNLKWLDVRNNSLKTIPESIKNHSFLETILLQNNKIEKIPLVLCTLNKLKHLQLSGNPIIFPNGSVIKSGTEYTLKFLKFYYDRENRIALTIDTKFDENEESQDIENIKYPSSTLISNENVSQIGPLSRNLKSTFRKKMKLQNDNVKFKEKSKIDNNIQINTTNNDSGTILASKKNTCLIGWSDIPTKYDLSDSKKAIFKIFNSNRYVKKSKPLNKAEYTLKVLQTAKEEKSIEKKKDLLNKREKTLQDIKSLEALRHWRDKYKESKENNPQTYYTLNLSALPYDVDVNQIKILTRADIEKDLPDKYRKRIRHNYKMTTRKPKEFFSLQNKIKDLKDTIEMIKLEDPGQTPRTKLETMSNDIRKLTDLKKSITKLKNENQNI